MLAKQPIFGDVLMISKNPPSLSRHSKKAHAAIQKKVNEEITSEELEKALLNLANNPELKEEGSSSDSSAESDEDMNVLINLQDPTVTLTSANNTTTTTTTAAIKEGPAGALTTPLIKKEKKEKKAARQPKQPKAKKAAATPKVKKEKKEPKAKKDGRKRLAKSRSKDSGSEGGSSSKQKGGKTAPAEKKPKIVC